MGQSTDLLQNYRQQDTLTKETITEFQKPIHKNRFFNNMEYLYLKSALIRFDKKSWFLRPEFFSYDYYGSPELFRVVLLINNISSRFNFRAENFRKGIRAPSLEAMRDVLSQNIQ